MEHAAWIIIRGNWRDRGKKKSLFDGLAAVEILLQRLCCHPVKRVGRNCKILFSYKPTAKSWCLQWAELFGSTQTLDYLGKSPTLFTTETQRQMEHSRLVNTHTSATVDADEVIDQTARQNRSWPSETPIQVTLDFTQTQTEVLNQSLPPNRGKTCRPQTKFQIRMCQGLPACECDVFWLQLLGNKCFMGKPSLWSIFNVSLIATLQIDVFHYSSSVQLAATAKTLVPLTWLPYVFSALLVKRFCQNVMLFFF